MTLIERLSHYEKLMRLDKPIGILLLLWPTLWGLWFAGEGMPPWLLIWVFVLGTVTMRSAGCVINDYADRDFDPHVERTRNRPLAAKAVSTKEALWLSAGLTLFSGLLILPLNHMVWALAVAAAAIAGTYPFTKRFFAIPQAYLGIAFGFGIPMAFAAQTQSLPPLCWALLAANIFWAIAYDTEYAMVDREDDIKIGIKTSALTFGRFDILAVMLCYLATIAILAACGALASRGWWYNGALVAASGIMGYHYTLIKDRERSKCFEAFLHNNWVGAIIFAGLALDYWFNPVPLVISWHPR